jgi:peptidoglycan/LPS O-acetylase OafA/YrhL
MNKKSPTLKKNPITTIPSKSALLPDVKRVFFVDGMRGIASVIVVFYHTLLSFYPAVLMFDTQYSHSSDLFEKKLTLSIFNIFYSGSFAVCMFFVISGYALSYNFFKNKNAKIPIIPAIVRRYFRLEIPILFSILLSFILLSSGAYTNMATAIQYTKSTFWFSTLWNIHPSLWEMLKESIYTTILKGGSIKYNTVLWTMCIEFIGSILVFIILAIFNRAGYV